MSARSPNPSSRSTSSKSVPGRRRAALGCDYDSVRTVPKQRSQVSQCREPLAHSRGCALRRHPHLPDTAARCRALTHSIHGPPPSMAHPVGSQHTLHGGIVAPLLSIGSPLFREWGPRNRVPMVNLSRQCGSPCNRIGRTRPRPVHGKTDNRTTSSGRTRSTTSTVGDPARNRRAYLHGTAGRG